MFKQTLSSFKRFAQLFPSMAQSIVSAFCFSNPILNGVTFFVLSPFIANLTRLGVEMDMVIENSDMKTASQWILERATHGVKAHNTECIPMNKPVLFVGNHAGLGDANAVMMSSPRRDTHTILINHGILPGLQAFHEYAIAVDNDNPAYTLRRTVRLLKEGKSVLLYPRGKIEDDPSLDLDLALDNLAHWSESIEFFVKHVPDLQVVPFGVGGVISRSALNNPIVRQYKDPERRLFLAATFQLAFPMYRDPIVSIFFGQPLSGEQATLANVQKQMRRLIKSVNAEQVEIFGEARGIQATLGEVVS